jgi:hypothetical protein
MGNKLFRLALSERIIRRGASREDILEWVRLKMGVPTKAYAVLTIKFDKTVTNPWPLLNSIVEEIGHHPKVKVKQRTMHFPPYEDDEYDEDEQPL